MKVPKRIIYQMKEQIKKKQIRLAIIMQDIKKLEEALAQMEPME